MYLIRQHPAEHRLGFLLFVGAAMSVTAFPVLARILSDRNIQRTRLGSLALTCAAIDDVLAWTLLAAVIAISGSGGDTPWLLLLAIPYGAAMVGVVRPLLRRYFADRERLTPGALGMIFVGVLVSGAITEWIGLHLLFGAFLFGTVMPRGGVEQLRIEIVGSIERFNGALLLPTFFIVAGLKVDLSGMGATGLLEFVLITSVAVIGKFGGAFAAARLHRLPSRQSALLATLMNTRGLTELIILSVGLQLGLLDGPLYSVMVVMALVTTAMAGPLLRLFGLKPDNPEVVDWEPAGEIRPAADLGGTARPHSGS
jgi:Kef-type K+ transport system membrane component KefB